MDPVLRVEIAHEVPTQRELMKAQLVANQQGLEELRSNLDSMRHHRADALGASRTDPRKFPDHRGD